MPLTTRLRLEIERLIAERPARKYLFMADKANPRSAKNWADFLYKIEAKAGVRQNVDFHGLRRTCVYRLGKKGVREGETAKILGDTVETISKHYDGMFPEDLDEAIRKIDPDEGKK